MEGQNEHKHRKSKVREAIGEEEIFGNYEDCQNQFIAHTIDFQITIKITIAFPKVLVFVIIISRISVIRINIEFKFSS